MQANKRIQINKLCEIENALNAYASDTLFLAIRNLRSNDELVKDLEQLSHLLTDCQDQANSIIDTLNNSNSVRSLHTPTSQRQGANDEK